MRLTVKCLVPTLAAALTLAACGSSSSSTGSSSQASTPAATTGASQASAAAVVKTSPNAKLGSLVLTNASGMTLYSLSGESAGKFICTSSACLQVWHPVTVAAAVTPTGNVGSLATVTRSDGTVQVTYKGMPLYTFASDKAPGEDNGQGIKDVGTWSAVKISPTTVAPTQAASEPGKPESSTSTSKGYGY